MAVDCSCERVCLFVDSFVTTIVGFAVIATYLYLPRFQFPQSVENCIHIEQVGAVCATNTVLLLKYKKSDCQKHVNRFEFCFSIVESLKIQSLFCQTRTHTKQFCEVTSYNHNSEKSEKNQWDIKMVQCDKSQSDALAGRPIGEIVRSVLSKAKGDYRITLGFSDAIKLLSRTPDEAQFCFLAEPARGDSATHMHEVLLEAFCYEHGIYIIKVDSSGKLAHVVGTLNANETCVLVRKSISNCTQHGTADGEEDDEAATEAATVSSKEEDILVNFCEQSWHNSDYCIVKLPES